MEALSFLRRLFGNRDKAGGPAGETLALCRKLLSERGEASGATLARETLAAWRRLDGAGRGEFFNALVRDYSPAPEAVMRAAEAYRTAPDPATLAQLQSVVEPLRQELFLRLNTAPEGTATLVAMRRELLTRLEEHPEWAVIDADLLHLFRSWFNRGFLRLERIDWRTSANVLEKLIEYEAVHEIKGWDDLRRRLQSDRRCFAFFHPALPEEPLIFIEVALTRELATRIAPLIDLAVPVEDPERATHAMFYSITNCQVGLRGVSFGNFLIKQVAEELQRRHAKLKTFATLSPLPGFARWLKGARERLGADLAPVDTPGWHEAKDAAVLGERLSALGAYYLLHAKRGSDPLDPVARFHLGNGAALERINTLADLSAAGLKRSAGLLVNYVYRLKDIETNHEAFVKEHRVIAAGAVEKLARDCPLAASSAEA